MFRYCVLILSCVMLFACKEDPLAEEDAATSVPAPVEPIKSKPTWEVRSFKNWYQAKCAENGTNCDPMGRATVLVEFAHNGCRPFREVIENQASLMQGYLPGHLYFFIPAASDALTRALYDVDHSNEPPCRVFFYNDTLKPDKKMPNEEQWFVELCKEATSVTSGECRSQLAEKRLYTP